MFKGKKNRLSLFINMAKENIDSTDQEKIFFETRVADKKVIKSNLIKVINIDKDFQERSDYFIDKLIDEICDLSQKTIKLMRVSEYDIKEIRALLGVSSGGKIDEHWKKDVIKKLRTCVIDNADIIVSTKVVDNRSKMSSLYIDRYKNYSIYDIGLSDISINRIIAYTNANTLYDLLTYPLYTLCIKLGVLILKDIKNQIYKLGLKFIDDLSIDEKKRIVSSSTKDMIENSHSIWIDIKHKYREMNTIKDIINKYDNHEFFDDDLLNYAYEIGIDFKQKEIDTYDVVKNMPLEERLDLNIKKIKMSTRLHNALHRAGIDTLRQIISFTPDKILKVKNMGSGTLDELIKILESIGLSLKEEEKKDPIEVLKEERIRKITRKEFLLSQLKRIDETIDEIDQKIMVLKNNQKM